jgi:beta-lactamase class D
MSDKSKRAVYMGTVGKNDELYQYASELNINEYLKYKTANIEGVKDDNGKTISGSKKQATLDYINNNISGYENRLWLMGENYKLSRSQQQDLAEYIMSANDDEELEIFKLFSNNFTVKDGKVYYK